MVTEPSPLKAREPRSHLVTVGLEDYFQVAAFHRVVQRRQWYRFERTVERGTRATLDLLKEHDALATFFVLGWVADELPELVREVTDAGHEVASKGYFHRGIQQMTPSEFREDLQRSREALEAATNQRILGYRVADKWLEERDLWALEVLAEEGYSYDSSIALIGRRFSNEPWRRFRHTQETAGGVLTEFPISSARVLGQYLPIAGGNYLRQLPRWIIERAVADWDRAFDAPFIMYFHTWEMDPDQPRIDAAPRIQKVRHYRNLAKMPELLGHFLGRYRFTSIASWEDLDLDLVSPQEVPRQRVASPHVSRRVTIPADGPTSRTPVTVVVPCYNEEVVIPYLRNTLQRVREALRDLYHFTFVFVDDASTDNTWEMLQANFGHRGDCVLLGKERNGGVARAVLSGILASKTEIVCSIDCDCSYDPHYLGSMIPLLEGVDLVTASPYHPEGGVTNVPGWRLLLSKTLSRFYRFVLGEDLHTYTACFRVYRKSAIAPFRISRGGYLGVAEMLGLLSLRGGKIREYPAVLEARVMGHSKMKVVKTIFGHLGLLAHLGWLRFTGRGGRAGYSASEPLEVSEAENLAQRARQISSREPMEDGTSRDSYPIIHV